MKLKTTYAQNPTDTLTRVERFSGFVMPWGLRDDRPALEKVLGHNWGDDPVRVRFERARARYEESIEQARPPKHERGEAELAAYAAKIRALDNDDRSMLGRLKRCTTGEEIDGLYLREAERYEALAGVAPPTESPQKEVRGHDRAPRKRKVGPPRAKPLSELEKRDRALAARVDRLVALLRRSPKGLSERAIVRDLKGGRTETGKALRRAMADGRVDQKGSLTSPLYYASNEVYRK